MEKIKVTVVKQETGEPVKKEIILNADEFDMYEDWFSYISGEKTGANGNSVMGTMIGKNYYVRFTDVIDISVEPYEAVE